MRSLATRRAHLATAAVLRDVIELYKAAGFDLVIVETAGIGQSDTEIVDLVDLSLYVMTSEYGAASQLEKIDMLDYADFIVLNKSEKRGAEDSLRDIRKAVAAQSSRAGAAAGRAAAGVPHHRQPLQRPRVNRLFAAVCAALTAKQIGAASWKLADPAPPSSRRAPRWCRGHARAYLAEIAEGARAARARIEAQAQAARRAFGLYESLKALHDAALPGPLERVTHDALNDAAADATRRELRAAYNRALDEIGAEGVGELKAWPARVRSATDAAIHTRCATAW